MKKQYNLEFDDVVTDADGHMWSQVCTGHAEIIDEEFKDNGLDEGGGGICGVNGCSFGSDFYLDF